MLSQLLKRAQSDEALDAARKAIHETTGRELPVTPRRPKPPGPLSLLLQAKMESDRRNYPAKHRIMRDLLMKRQGEFAVDSDNGKGIVGITHQPTSFRMHLPRPVTAGLIPPPNRA